MLSKSNNKGVAHEVAPFPFVVRGAMFTMTKSDLISRLAGRHSG